MDYEERETCEQSVLRSRLSCGVGGSDFHIGGAAHELQFHCRCGSLHVVVGNVQAYQESRA